MACKIIQIGGSTAFICGAPLDHVCNEDAGVFILADGSQIPDTPENWEKHKNDIYGGSVACSICGRAAIDDAPYLDF